MRYARLALFLLFVANVWAETSEARGSDTRQGRGRNARGPVKPTLADTARAQVYADNWFALCINGKLVAVDSIDFLPHNVVSVDLLPEYPMTIAVLAKDNADPATGLEYGDHIGDGGFILKFSDGTITDGSWKARCFFRGPIHGDVRAPRVEHTPIPANWFAVDFDDRDWSRATVYSEQQVRPKEAFHRADFTGAKWIWSENLELDNTVIFRTRIERPGWRPAWTTRPELDVRGVPLP